MKENIVMVNPQSGINTKAYQGFSFPCLIFGFFWYMSKGMYAWAAVHFFASFITQGFAWFVFPFIANNMYKRHLADHGYIPVNLTYNPAIERIMGLFKELNYYYETGQISNSEYNAQRQSYNAQLKNIMNEIYARV